MPDDPHIQQTEEVADKAAQQRFADLFDVRRVIGGLFAVYAVILLIASFFATDEDVERAQGINANLWVGLALLATAAIFFGWALRAPVGAQLVDADGNGGGAAEAPGEQAAPSAAAQRAAERERKRGSRREDA
jgi:hypothetical protein